jgi:Ca2+-binding RTX toxin-like protein
MTVTLTGAFGSSAYVIDYDNRYKAYVEAAQFIKAIDAEYTSAVYYPNETIPHTGALIVGNAVLTEKIGVKGFGAVVVENTESRTTLWGGTPGGDQVVLAGTGGLTYGYVGVGAGNVTVDAGGGNNFIDLGHDSAGTGVVYTSAGNDTIYASQGTDTIWAGLGDNSGAAWRRHGHRYRHRHRPRFPWQRPGDHFGDRRRQRGCVRRQQRQRRRL